MTTPSNQNNEEEYEKGWKHGFLTGLALWLIAGAMQLLAYFIIK